jgi:hypothetical protein
VAVRQVTGSKKEYVRKDLIIWPTEDMTVWIANGTPAVVMEWKINDPNECKKDSAWLADFCAKNPKTLGVSACATLTNGNRGCQIITIIDLLSKNKL